MGAFVQQMLDTNTPTAHKQHLTTVRTTDEPDHTFPPNNNDF